MESNQRGSTGRERQVGRSSLVLPHLYKRNIFCPRIYLTFDTPQHFFISSLAFILIPITLCMFPLLSSLIPDILFPLTFRILHLALPSARNDQLSHYFPHPYSFSPFPFTFTIYTLFSSQFPQFHLPIQTSLPALLPTPYVVFRLAISFFLHSSTPNITLSSKIPYFPLQLFLHPSTTLILLSPLHLPSIFFPYFISHS